MKNKDKQLSYLILGGTGQVGRTIAIKLINLGVKKIIIHGLLKSETVQTKRSLTKYQIGKKKKTLIIETWGNIFSPTELKDINFNDVIKNNKSRNTLLQYLTTNNKKGYLISIVNNFKPRVIINCTNYATYLGYRNIVRKEMSNFIEGNTNAKNKSTTSINRVVESIFRRSDIYLAKWFEELFDILKSGSRKFIEVSTTGFGGMGFNLLWTHGEPNQNRASEELISKAMVAGMSHQLLWNLAHTPEINVHLVIPTALIAWEEIFKHEVIRNGQSLKVSSKLRVVNIQNNKGLKKIFLRSKALRNSKIFKGLGISTGENGFFGREEFKAITSFGQMELVTKEEVAESVINIIQGNLDKDILRSMEKGSLQPSKNFLLKRNKALKKLDADKKEMSLAYGNLGPYITKLVFELFLLSICLSSIVEIKNIKLNELKKRLNKVIIDKKILSYITSVGIPVMYNDGKSLLYPRQSIYPSKTDIENSKLDKKLINHWAEIGWIDLRDSNLRKWVKNLKKIINVNQKIKLKNKNYKTKFNKLNINNQIDVGDTLSFLLTMEGGGRRID